MTEFETSETEHNEIEKKSLIDSFIDRGGFLWGLFGFLTPVFGLLVYLILRDIKPRTAKAVGIGSLVSVILCVLFFVLFFVFGIVLGIMADSVYYY